MKIKLLTLLLTGVLAVGTLAGCSGKREENVQIENADIEIVEDAGEETEAETEEPWEPETVDVDLESDTEIQVFVAASLNTVMTEIAEKYNEAHPNVKVTFHADSSGTLLTQIREGYACDLFFSAAQTQMDELEEAGLIIDGTRADVLNNQVVVIGGKDSGTAVTGLLDIANAESIALAGGNVPAGKYTRQALVNLGMLEEAEDVSLITTEEISAALDGAKISEQDNVSKVLIAVTEGACEVGTAYYSDTYGYEDKVDVLETVNHDLTGNVIYPVCRVANAEADEVQSNAADDFLNFILSEEAKEIFDAYYFDTNLG